MEEGGNWAIYEDYVGDTFVTIFDPIDEEVREAYLSEDKTKKEPIYPFRFSMSEG